MKAAHEKPDSAGLEIERPSGDSLLLLLTGNWKLNQDLPKVESLQTLFASDPKPKQVAFDASGLTGWDSALLTFLTKLRKRCTDIGIQLDSSGLPEGARRMLVLAAAVPEQKDTGRKKESASFLDRLGTQALEALRSSNEVLDFIGEVSLAFLKFITGRANYRRSDLLLIIQECGPRALGIVSLISILIGLILAFVGAVQLALFGAEIYVASLVTIGMTREMGAMMTAIIMAGRTGAAFAAQLGTMEVNEEIDALRTMGIDPMEFLVLPRMLALIVMMPLLCVYADLMGILGGFIVSVGTFDITFTQYVEQTHLSLKLRHIFIGIFKAGFFGILIAISGCMRGMQCGRSASEVGNAATAAVVTAIIWIIVWDGIFAVVTNVLGI